MSVIKYFTKMGDQEVSNIFTSYLWNERGLDRLLEKGLEGKDYGADLELILIQYYVEGRFAVNGPAHPKVSNYSKKNKDISIAISVKADSFHNRNEFERREFIVDSTLNALELVKEKVIKNKLDVDFNEMLNDVRTLSEEYLKYPRPYYEN